MANSDFMAAHAKDDEEKLSFFHTCFNGLNALSGVGILSVSYALASGGWLSLTLLFLIASMDFYTALLIKKCAHTNMNLKTYPDIGEQAFGKKGRIIVTLTMCAELYLVPIGFLILEGDNLSKLFPNVELQLGGLTISGKHLFVMLVALLIWPTMWLDKKSISYVSAIGVFAPFIIILSISWTAAIDGVGFHEKGTLIRWNGIANAVSLYAFCYGAHALFPAMYSSMRNKNQFSNVLIVCFSLATAGYASMAIIGYRMFGSGVQSQVTLNLPLDKISSKVAIYSALVNPIAKYALLTTPVVNALKGLLPLSYKNRVTSILIGTLLLISTVVVAVTIPFFGYLMALVGALLNVTLSMLIPCLCYLKISGTHKTLGCEMVVIVMIMIVGIAIGIFGTYTSIFEIVHHL